VETGRAARTGTAGIVRVYFLATLGRAFSNSYLAGEPAALAFFAPRYRDPVARVARTRTAAQRATATCMVQILRAQQAGLPPSPARAAHLAALTEGRAAVVATGQQIGLFLGPLYSFYKAASAVAVARALSAETGVPCVPLFWLQTEDHDFAEIQSCVVPDRQGEPLRLTLPDPGEGDDRSSVAYRKLPAEVVGLLDRLAEALPPGEAASEALALLRTAYRPGRLMGAAFAEVMAELFADEGLLVLDPRRSEVAALAAPVYRACLEDSEAIAAALSARGRALDAAGFSEQVPVREHAALVFFHPDGPEGPRFRIERQPGASAQWRLAGRSDVISQARLLEILAQEPLRFSTSSLLRPLVQDLLLPTVAYVAGPGEINYFGQLGPLYQRFELDPPLLVPRARFRCLDGRSRRDLAKLGLAPDDLALPIEKLAARLGADRPTGAPDPDELRARVASRIATEVEQIVGSVERAVPGLRREADRTRASLSYRLDRLISGYARALVERDEVLAAKLHRLARFLFPQGSPQERVYGWPAMAARSGVARFKALVQARLGDPFIPTVQDLEL
jgi:bacillithiol synthase